MLEYVLVCGALLSAPTERSAAMRAIRQWSSAQTQLIAALKVPVGGTPCWDRTPQRLFAFLRAAQHRGTDGQVIDAPASLFTLAGVVRFIEQQAAFLFSLGIPISSSP
jgi:hypothetical protein